MEKKIIIFLLFIGLLVSCNLEPFSIEKDSLIKNEMNQTQIIESTELFIYDVENDRTVFSTNDKKYITSNGFTLLTTNKINTSESFEEVESIIYKESGNQDAGYGVVFCEQEIVGERFLLCVMINITGEYIVGKVNGCKFSPISKWKSCVYLNKGYGVKNKLNIFFNEEEKIFKLKINNYRVEEFVVEDKFSFHNSRSGLVVVVSNREKFPEEAVRVLFER